jgi:hypothetical protein
MFSLMTAVGGGTGPPQGHGAGSYGSAVKVTNMASGVKDDLY